MTRRLGPVRARRAFTLLEVLIVLGVILILASLVLGVGSALLKNAERSQVQASFVTMESAFNEWEAQTGRPLTYNGAFNLPLPPHVEVFPSGSSVEVFDVREPAGTPAGSAGRQIITRARGAGVYAVNLLPQVEAVRPILAGIPPSLLRPETAASPLAPPTPAMYPPINVSTGTPAVLYTPSAASLLSPFVLGQPSPKTSRSEFVDTWGNRIAFVFPGRAYRYGVDTGNPDPDGTVRTPLENLAPGFGVCTNRRICLVSAGPDGLFGVVGDAPGTLSAAQAAAFLQTAAADNVYLYELDPPN